MCGRTRRWLAYLVAAFCIAAAGCTVPSLSPPERSPGVVRLPSLPNVRSGVWSARIVSKGYFDRFGQVGQVLVYRDGSDLVAADRSTGVARWRRAVPGLLRIVSGLLVLVAEAQLGSDAGSVEVIDPATGATRWRVTGHIQQVHVLQDAVYETTCQLAPSNLGRGCTTTAREVRDGRVRWSARGVGLSGDLIGPAVPDVPPGQRYLPVYGDRTEALIDTTNGRVLRAAARTGTSWYEFAAGPVLVTTDHDPPDSDSACTITVSAIDVRTGARAWAHPLYSGRRADGTCAKRLADHENQDRVVIGAGTWIAAATSTGRPQAVDLKTGRPLWTGSEPGIPIDGTDRAILVRRQADAGGIAMLDARTGALRWTAPDPGLSGRSVSWHTAVSQRLVAVTGAVGDRPRVVVYEAMTGRQLGVWPGWLHGVGEDWVAVTHDGRNDDTITLDVISI
ncbi:outer membrane protein assembly factor BamB family protein [Micromonospora sp. CPCC 206061]|uniref:outer membrane protein assembly factor BamB family protein n=1 Tax=Micromonospora sp. CPCC 206061 TaxID=3122410 RepID=UPI002FF34FE8